MHHIVATVDRVTNRILHALRLQPGLSLLVVNVRVSAHKGEVGAELVEKHKQVLRHFAIESRDVAAAIWMSSYSILKEHIHAALKFI